jgi:membrane-bound lytic murein transglycosylase A
MRAWGVAALAVAVSACSSGVVPSRPGTVRPAPSGPSAPVRQPTAATPLPPKPAPAASATTATAASVGLVAGPDIADLPITAIGATRALEAFRISCPSLVKRTDASGLTRAEDWRAACDAARTVQPRDATTFFARYFEAVQVADGKAFATGYYEPEISGSRTRRSGFEVPIYGRPADLIDVDLGTFSDNLKGRSIRGRVDGTKFVPFYDRTAIEQGALQGRGLEIAWAADPVELFFLQIQGSGRLRLPDGGIMRIGYASQNGADDRSRHPAQGAGIDAGDHGVSAQEPRRGPRDHA